MEKSKTQLMQEEYHRDMVRDRLEGDELAQAEAIGNHYCYLAQTAITLRELIRMRRNLGHNEESDKAIRYLSEQIRKTHYDDFDIALEWPDSRDCLNRKTMTEQEVRETAERNDWCPEFTASVIAKCPTKSE